MLQKWLRLPNRKSDFQLWKEEAYQEAISNELEREMSSAAANEIQLALIPNMKKCVRGGAQGGLFDGRDDDST